jgi:hypothetical protein
MTFASLMREYGPFPSPDVRDVVTACDALNVREIKLFRLAFARWFGRDASEAELEGPFMRYLFAHRSPMWVRQFARDVLRQKTQGVLDPASFGLPPRSVRADGDDAFEGVCRVLLVVAWAGGVGSIARKFFLWGGG